MPRSIIRKGASALPMGANDGPFIGLKDGDVLDVVPLIGIDEIVAFDQHAIWLEDTPSIMVPCLQDETCPCCAINDKPRYRAMIIVQVKGENGVEEKVLPMGIGLTRDLAELDEAMEGGIKGAILRVKRTGSGLRTRYSIIPTGGRAKKLLDPTLDLEELAGTTDPDEISALLLRANLVSGGGKELDDDEQEEEAPPRKSRKPKSSKPAPKTGKPVDEENEDEEDDDDWA